MKSPGRTKTKRTGLNCADRCKKIFIIRTYYLIFNQQTVCGWPAYKAEGVTLFRFTLADMHPAPAAVTNRKERGDQIENTLQNDCGGVTALSLREAIKKNHKTQSQRRD